MAHRVIKKVVVWCLVFVMAFSTFASASVSALDKGRSIHFSNYQIYFYDPDAANCIPGTTVPGQGGSSTPFVGDDKWDGSCTDLSGQRAAWIEKYLSTMQKIATNNGLPWELIAAQKFQESGTPDVNEKLICDNNPLGLKANKEYIAAGKYCDTRDGKFAKFPSIDEAFQYYANTAAMRKVKYKYPNDPYSAIAYVQSGSPPYYAVCDNESYPGCKGHMGEPTPGYVKSVSSIICGIQKWAKSKGIAISTVTWETYLPPDDKNPEPTPTPDPTPDPEPGTGAVYCDDDGSSDDYEEPEEGNLESYVKAWAWPTYHKAPYTDRKPAYADYIDNQATYKGDCGGVDCGAFVANIIKASGWDPNYPQAGTDTQKTWLAANWNKVSVDSLKLGDVGIKDGHVILYVGNIPGFNSNTASASQCDRAPMAGADSNLSIYTWYRKR